jgi:hypothetical protein
MVKQADIATAAPVNTLLYFSGEPIEPEPDNLYVGTNQFSVAVKNPESRALTVELSVLRESVKFSGTNLESTEPLINNALLYTLDGSAPATITFVCTVMEKGAPVAERWREVFVQPFAKEIVDLGLLADQIRARLPQLKSGAHARMQKPEDVLYRIQALLPSLKRARW